MTIQLDQCLRVPPNSGAVQQPPYLFVDLYSLDLDDPRTKVLDDPPWEKAFVEPRLTGAIMKAFDGIAFRQDSVDWFIRNFKKLTTMFGARRGVNRFVGGYHYAQFFRDPIKQADAYLAVLLKAGWTPGKDIVPIIDVEFGGERAANRKASAQQVINCISAIAERLKAQTGVGCMLYGRGAMRDLNIASKMGCDRVWNPSYTETIVTNGLCELPNGKPAPWKLSDIKLWQYGGDGVGDDDVHHLPLDLTSFGKVDMSVFISGAQRTSMELVREGLL